MPEATGALLSELWQLPGLIWVVAITFVAGVVYGFAGFGAALVYMPVATIFLPVEMVVAAFAVTALASLATVVPRAWGQSDQRGVSMMIVCAVFSIPVGLWILRTNDVTTMRWAVLTVSAITLVALVSGWRYTTRPTRPAQAGVALAAGLVGGATGLVGPIMVLFQLGGQDSISRSRANALVFLTVTGTLMLPMMAWMGMLSPASILLGGVLLVPYGVASWIGQMLFDPDRQGLYRAIAYAIIGAAILLGLPIYS